jgi:phage replication O-like protein O
MAREFEVKRSMQYPNVLVDEILPDLKPSAVKVLNVIVRKTFGWQKLSDELSLSQLEKLTKLRRAAVVAAVAELERIEVVTIRRGAKGQGSNVYTLNVDIGTGLLVRKSNQFEFQTSSHGSLKIKLSKTQTKDRRLFSIENKATPVRARQIPDPRVKTLIGSFCSKYEAKAGSSYVPAWGKESSLIKGLLTAGQIPEAIETAMDRYFADEFSGRAGFDIGRFVASFNRLKSAQTTDSERDSRNTDPRRVVAPKGKYDAFK